MISAQDDPTLSHSHKTNYNWVIVAISAILFFNHGLVIYSYSVFFKPLSDAFDWNRSSTSLAYSLEFIFLAFSQVFAGWSVDKFGPRKVMIVCGIFSGLALFLASRITELWQLYLIYGPLLGLGISGANVICTVTTARWFTKRRGLALGIVSAGVGLGTSVGIPVVSRLINSPVGWQNAYVILAVFAAVVMITGSLFLRVPPNSPSQNVVNGTSGGSFFKLPADRRPLFMVLGIYFLFSVMVQIMMVHLVNYAIDLDFSPLVAATLMTVVGTFSVIGRLVMGTASDRIGTITSILICCMIIAISYGLIIFSKQIILLYLVAGIFGLGYGGEVPQITPTVGAFYGFESTSKIVGLVFCGGNLGGALGAWLAGFIFDLTHSYVIAFVLAAASGIGAIFLALSLSKLHREYSAQLS